MPSRVISPAPTREEVAKELELMSRPLDLEPLIASGVLTKKGSWYLVRNMRELPEHVARRISETATGPEGTLVRFYKSRAKVAKTTPAPGKRQA